MTTSDPRHHQVIAVEWEDMRLLELFEHYAYESLILVIFVEELGVPLPLPGDALMLMLGITSLEGKANFWIVLLLACIFTWAGASILFFVAQHFGRPLLHRYQSYLRYIHVTPEDVDAMEHYMAHYGSWVLFVARLTPGLRTLATIGAGVLGVPYRKFLTATMAGTIFWTAGYFWLGVLLGRRFADQIELIFGNKLLMGGIFVLGLLMWLGLFKLLSPQLKKHRHAKDKTLD